MIVFMIGLALIIGSPAYAGTKACNETDVITLQPTSCANTEAVFQGALSAARQVVSDKVNTWTVTANSAYVTNFCNGIEVWPIHFGEPGNFGIDVHVTVQNCEKFSAEE